MRISDWSSDVCSSDLPPELVGDTVLFLHLLMIGYLPSVWFSVLRAFSAALSRPRPALVFMILAVLLNAVAVYGLTFGAGLGIVGEIGRASWGARGCQYE